MRVALAQLNPVVGDIAGNTALVLEAMERARGDGADLLVTPELALVGYPPRDLLFRAGVVEACEAAVRRIAERAGAMHVVVGHPRRVPGGVRPLRNSASVCHDGRAVAVHDKQLLPGYDVFDEDRYFEPGDRTVTVEVAGRRIGLLICEDLWRADDVRVERAYDAEPLQELVKEGCDLLVALNASHFVPGKWERHLQQLRGLVARHGLPIVTVNQVGANDDLIYEGRSALLDEHGGLRALLPAFEPSVAVVDLERPPAIIESVPADPHHDLFAALVLGVRDYCRKTGHDRVLVGLSGGIDSALTAVIAVAALGPDGVLGVTMPSRYSSDGARRDAAQLAAGLGLGACPEISIEQAHADLRSALERVDATASSGLPDENVQARLRGLLLMALSNAGGGLVLATSNKSEIAVGYSTLYGDMCGAVSVIGDLLKTRVYDLARWINANHRLCGFASAPIPEASIEKPPSAELRPNQTDQDTLPPYEQLDEIIRHAVELELAPRAIAEATGLELELVRTWVRRIDLAQFKRDQASVILKVSPRTFGRGRPMPIVMRWSESGADAPTAGDRQVAHRR